MNITEQIFHGSAVLDLRGRFDFSARREFERAIRKAQKQLRSQGYIEFGSSNFPL